MKKVTAMLLTFLLLVALFPASIVAQAETVTKEGFYLVNWDRDFESGDYNHVYWMPYTWINSSNFDANTESVNIGVYFNGYSSSDIKAAAAELRDEFNNRPAGSRYINLAALGTIFKDCVKDAIDMEDGVRLVADWVDRFLAEYKSVGGQLDGIAIDLEYNSYTSHYLQSNFCTKTSGGGDPVNLDIMQDIVRNERVYQAILRPQLVEYEKQGLFKFYTKNINPQTGLPDDLSTAVGPEYSSRVPIPVSEITTINRYDDNGGDANSRSTWSWVMQNYLAGCITRAAYDPMIKYYPDAILSDYSTSDVYGWHKGMSNTGGGTGTAVKAGNASNGVYYGSQFSEYYWASSSGSKTRKLYAKPAGYNGAVFDPTDPYTRVLHDVNNQKRLLASTIDKMGAENAKINVWVPYFHYANTEKSYGNSPYFTEVMYHLGLTNPEPFLGYIIESEVKNKGKYYDDEKMGDDKYALQVSDEILSELTRVAGASDRKPIQTPVSWNEGYILSGMYAGGRNIWRLTPDTGKVSVEDFKIQDTAPTFRVGNMTITFPNGRIIKDSKISSVGSCGYWIETPANVTPVVTTTADRYANDPAFGEDFSNYKTGAFTASSSSMLTTTSGRPDTYWTVDGTAEIKKNGNNQVLSLTGTTTLTNSKIVEHITAGDYYAKQQIWEVKVTLPEGDYGEVKVLSCEDIDGGIKIAGGKVYYDQQGAYKELTDVNLTAGTYIFKREVDLRRTIEPTCSYTICDAAGNRLGGTEMVPMPQITAPVSKLTISTTDAAAAVELDDYKLYPTGVTAQLDLYETSRGRKLSTNYVTRTEDTVYRVSWMNATDKHQVVRVYDSKTGTILQKVEMAPGMDGLITGIAKASKDNPILLDVHVQETAGLTHPDYTTGNFAWTAAGESIGLAAGTKGAAGTETLPPTGDGIGEAGDNIDPILNPKTESDTPENEPSGNIPSGNIPSGSVPSGGDNGTPEQETPATVADGDAPAAPEEKKGLSGGMIVLIVCLVLAAGGAAVYFFVIKPKMAAKYTEE